MPTDDRFHEGLRNKSIVALLAIQLLVGAYLAVIYKSSASEAHSTTLALHQLPHAILQGFHYWGSAVLIVVAFASLTIEVFRRKPSLHTGLIALASIGIGYGFQLTGNLLPFDRHGVQTATIEGGIASQTPLIGKSLHDAIMGGQSVSEQTLLRWFTIHRVFLPLAALGLLAIVIRLYPPKRWRWFDLGLVGIVSVISFFIKSPIGSTASDADFSSFNAVVSWYVWPLHGSMTLANSIFGGRGWIGAMLIPGTLIAFILLRLTLSNRVVRRFAFGAYGVLAVWFVVAAFGFAGRFASLTGTRDPIEKQVDRSKYAPIDKLLADKGRKLFNRLPCSGCHGENGVNGSGGPSLARIFRKHSDADYYVRYIQNPRSIASASTMPSFGDIHELDLRAIAEFLRSPK